MFKATDTQGILSNSMANDDLKTWLKTFLVDRKVQGVSEGTFHFYQVIGFNYYLLIFPIHSQLIPN